MNRDHLPTCDVHYLEVPFLVPISISCIWTRATRKQQPLLLGPTGSRYSQVWLLTTIIWDVDIKKWLYYRYLTKWHTWKQDKINQCYNIRDMEQLNMDIMVLFLGSIQIFTSARVASIKSFQKWYDRALYRNIENDKYFLFVAWVTSQLFQMYRKLQMQ